MGREISIAISAKDNFSQAITTMRNANQSFNKDLTGLQTKLNELNKTKSTLKVDAAKARTDLKEAEKQFAKTGSEAHKLNLEMANADYEQARRNLSLVTSEAKQAEKSMLSLSGVVSKNQNQAGSGSLGGNSMLSTIAKSGAVGMVGNVLGELTTTYIGSAYGNEAGTLASSALSSATIGAMVGSVAGPIGTAVGALGGAILGYIQGQNKIFESKNDAFKDYYTDLYDTVKDNQEQALTSGTSIASNRETNRISFSTLLGGETQADKFLSSLTDFASVTPFAYDELTNVSKVLLAYGYKQDEILPLLEKVGDTGSALGLSSEDMKFVATSLGRMQTTDKTTLEYLNPLLERGIDVWSYLAEAYLGEATDETRKKLQEMVSDGDVPGGEAAKAIADYMGSDFAGNMEKQAQTFAGLTSTLEDAMAELNNAMGQGYTSTRKEGMQDEIDWLSGEGGEQMQDAYNKMGQWQASLENKKEELNRDAISSVMDGTLADSYINSKQKDALERLIKEYKIAEAEYYDAQKQGNEEAMLETGAKMGEILAEAQAIAVNEYNASDGAQLQLETNMSIVKNIREDSNLKDEYWNAGYVWGLEVSKGYKKAIGDSNTYDYDMEEVYEWSGGEENLTPEQKKLLKDNKGRAVADHVKAEAMKGNGKAYGFSYVPYDNFPALLHEGERVLTASENRNYGSSTPISITGNTFVVRQESDIKSVAQEIARMMNQAYTLAN
ncbi:MAG: phage tape measure protein [Herbinix sp.]|jgi:tape measure domain-containing protein|nr:phage tape measure protein [Herbinix sp.]